MLAALSPLLDALDTYPRPFPMAKGLLFSSVAITVTFIFCCCGSQNGGRGDGVANAFSSLTPLTVSSAKSCCKSRKSRSLLFAEVSPGDGNKGIAGAGSSSSSSSAVEITPAAGTSSLEEQKASLMKLILSTSIEEQESEEVAEEVNAIIASLEDSQQGFQESKVDGEWVLCFTRNSQGSPSLQKALPGDRGFQNFDIRQKKFFNIAQLWGGRVKVLADVAYEVSPEEPNKLQSTIVGAGLKLGPVRLPLPLTGRVGYLEFIYQDEDIRVTRGNRGGLFLHMRPGSSFAMDSGEA